MVSAARIHAVGFATQESPSPKPALAEGDQVDGIVGNKLRIAERYLRIVVVLRMLAQRS